MSQRVLDALKERFGDAVVSVHSFRGDDTAVVLKERFADAARYLRDDPAMAFDLPNDLTCVDFLPREPRFEVVAQLYSTKHKHRVRLKCTVDAGPDEEPVVPSLTPLYPGLNWFEREAWDMFGVKFAGHPDLRRMFMYEQFVGHPLRKDYPKEKRQPLARREGT